MHDITIEDMIADEDMVITVTRAGYVKRSPLAMYREQSRGGKGRKGMETKDDDFVEHLYIASAHSYVLVFTESGRVHWIKVHRIPELSPASRGKAIVNLLDLEPKEKVATTVAVRDFEQGYLIFATENGTVKKTALEAYSNPRVGGIIAINIDEGDRLLDVRLTDGESDVLLATAGGYSIRFPETTETPEEGSKLEGVRVMGRVARGVRGLALRSGDQVVSLAVLDREGDLLTFTASGFGKRTRLDEYRRQSRGGKGILNLDLKRLDQTGPVVGVKQVQDGHSAMLITQGGKLIRIPIDDTIRTVGRASKGVKVMNLGSDDRLVAVAKIVEEDEEIEARIEDSESAEGAEATDVEAGVEDAAGDESIEDEPVN